MKKNTEKNNKKIFSENNNIPVENAASVEIKTEDLSKRYFNQVGGFEYLPLEIPLKANETVKVKFTVKDGEKVLAVSKKIKAAPGEMEKITVKADALSDVVGPITVCLEVL